MRETSSFLRRFNDFAFDIALRQPSDPMLQPRDAAQEMAFESARLQINAPNNTARRPPAVAANAVSAFA